jgi:hypothetical protein
MNSQVDALTTYDGQLVAAGGFTLAGGVAASHIASWNGSSWQAFPGAGVWSTSGGFEATALGSYGGRLVVGGWFDRAGGVAVNNIATWDGTSWGTLGAGVAGAGGNSAWVKCLIESGGQLFVGGIFEFAGGVAANGVARWDGSAWHALGSGMGWGNRPSVNALAVYNSELIAGGEFTSAGGASISGVARWDGSTWQPLGLGLGGPLPYVFAMAVYNGELVVGGVLTVAGGQPANYIARWNGSSWQTLGSGMASATGLRRVDALTVHDGELIAGGVFEMPAV